MTTRRPYNPDALPNFMCERTADLLAEAFDEADGPDPVEDYADLAGIVRSQDNDW